MGKADEAARIRAAKKRLEGSPTPKQIKFIEGLLIDCGFTTRLQRNVYLSRIFETDIRFLDELTFSEAGELIDTLLKKKMEQATGEDDDED